MISEEFPKVIVFQSSEPSSVVGLGLNESVVVGLSTLTGSENLKNPSHPFRCVGGPLF